MPPKRKRKAGAASPPSPAQTPQKPQKPDTTDKSLQKVFDQFDTDHSGSISVDELHKAFQTLLSMDVGIDLVKKIMDEVDVDHSGEISFDEFKRLMQRDWLDEESSPLFKAQTAGGGAARRPSSAPQLASADPAASARLFAEQGGKKGKETVRVMVRVRPFMPYERRKAEERGLSMEPVCYMVGKDCQIFKVDNGQIKDEVEHSFKFDECFWSLPKDQCAHGPETATQEDVFNCTGVPAVDHAFVGYNTCIFAYGQTGSGKTHTMLGNDADPGIAPRLVELLFQRIKACHEAGERTKFTVSICFMEIYNEKVMDLMMHEEGSPGPPMEDDPYSPESPVASQSPGSPEPSEGSPGRRKSVAKAGRKGRRKSVAPTQTDESKYRECKVRQSPDKGTFVDGITRLNVHNAQETMRCMHGGMSYRATACHDLNATSSRSHAIFQLTVKQDTVVGTTRVSTMNIVDLAGSERQKATGASGSVLTEAKNINQSLSTLRRVMDVLVENSKTRRNNVPPFRESMLTWVLKDSLGGNSKTVMIAAISPHLSNLDDTINTLRYALKAKSIVLHAQVNEEKTATMVAAMKNEIELLRQQLLSGGGGAGGVDEDAVRREVEAQIKEREAEFTEAQEQAEHLKKEVEQAKKEHEEKEKELEKQAHEEKKNRFAAVFRQAFRIEAARVEQESKIGALTQQVKEAQDEAERVRQAAEERESRDGAEISRMQRELNGHVQRTAELERTRIDLENKLAKSERRAQDLEDRVARMSSLGKEEVERLQRDLDRLRGVDKERDRLQVELADTQARLRGVTAEADALDADKRTADAAIRRLEDANERLQRECKQLQRDGDDARHAAEARWEEMERLRDEMDRKTRADAHEIRLRDERIAELTEDRDSLRNDVARARHDKGQADEDCAQLKRERMLAKYNIVHQANDLEESRARIQQLEAELGELRQQLSLTEAKLTQREYALGAHEQRLSQTSQQVRGGSVADSDVREYVSGRYWKVGDARARDVQAAGSPSRYRDAQASGSPRRAVESQQGDRQWMSGPGAAGYRIASGGGSGASPMPSPSPQPPQRAAPAAKPTSTRTPQRRRPPSRPPAGTTPRRRV
eukprot:TRINITY_DN211_c1_g4_i3.p1 TRINITY_DN211_c1_g4~~TRINITY_DN211_c1_g4_i3.p1  ORF type:complete len:1099 (+),score=419.49 TRINITY_DN211_c1_g4_i3:82-3378(+)